MIITIPTYGRVGKQITLASIPKEWLHLTYLVVQEREYTQHLEQHGHLVNILALPDNVRDIATTRDWIIERFPGGSVLMLDDDLTFARRRTDDRTKFRNCTKEDLTLMFDMLEVRLTGYDHVGMSGREGANRNTHMDLFNTRAMRVLGYNPRKIKAYELKFAPGGFMCDFHMTLELLKRGYPNCVYNDFVHNQPGSNTAGGCSEQRTSETQAAAAIHLAEMHPEYVKVVEKHTKGSWNGKARIDVVVQWKRAFGAGQEAAVLDKGEGECTHEEGGFSL
jgi:hypothetical protein